MQGRDDPLTIIEGFYGQEGEQTFRKPLTHKPATVLHLRAHRSHPGPGPEPLKGFRVPVHVLRALAEGLRKGSPTVRTVFQKRGGHRSEEFTETSSV